MRQGRDLTVKSSEILKQVDCLAYIRNNRMLCSRDQNAWYLLTYCPTLTVLLSLKCCIPMRILNQIILIPLALPFLTPRTI